MRSLIGALAVLGGVLAFVAVTKRSPVSRGADRGTQAVQAASPESESILAPTPSEGRDGGHEPRPSPAVVARGEAAGWLIRGEVVDLDGNPVVGIEVGVPAAAARTNERGGFSLRASQRGTQVEPLTGNLSVVARARRGDGGTQRLIVAPAMTVAGRVLDEHDLPLVDVEIEVELDAAGLADVPRSAEMRLMVWSATSRADGCFVLDRLPRGLPGTMSFAHAERSPVQIALPETERTDLIVRLPTAAANLVAGQVLTEEGQPAAGALVAVGGERVRADAAGFFRLALGERADDLELVASHPRYGVARVAGEALAAGELVLELRPPDGLLAGVLVDTEARPLSDWRVSVLFAGGDSPLAEACTTDAEGRFVLRGEFGEQELWLEAWGKTARTTATLGPLASGSDGIVWTVEAARFRDPHAAVVVTPDGRAVEGARVTVAPVVQIPGGAHTGHDSELRLSDKSGGVELTRVPYGALRLKASKPGFEDQVVQLSGGDPLPARIELPRLCDVSVQATASGLSLAFLDGAGVRLPIRRAFGASSANTLAGLEDGGTSRFLVGESARTMIVFERGAELYRQPVRLRADATTTFRP